MNAGTMFVNGEYLYFDLQVTNRTLYQNTDARKNGMYNRLARFDVKCNTDVTLRTQVTLSCNKRTSCQACNAISSLTDRAACYSSGCSCFGNVIYRQELCEGQNYQKRRARYSCQEMHLPAAFPSGSILSMTIYDFDSMRNAVGGLVEERVFLERYSYFKTPLRTGDAYPPETVSKVAVTPLGEGVQFASTEVGTQSDDPFTPGDLNPSQAQKGVQVFIESEFGYLEGKFSVVDTGVISGYCNAGRQFMIGGDSGLCESPPSLPPSPSPPPSPPPYPPMPPSLPPPPPPPAPPPPSPPPPVPPPPSPPPPDPSPPPPLPPPPPPSPPTPPSPPAPSPPPPQPSPPCTFDISLMGTAADQPSLCAFSLIVRGNADVASNTFGGALAVGGKLNDMTPTQIGSVPGYSYIGSQGGGQSAFVFPTGFTQGVSSFPFDWVALEFLAAVIQPSTSFNNGPDIIVRCTGGVVTMSDFYASGMGNTRTGTNTLIVFNTNAKVILALAPDGTKFRASVLAPFSTVEIASNIGEVDGFIVAKKVKMFSTGGGVSLKGNCFQSTIECAGLSAGNCGNGGAGFSFDDSTAAAPTAPSAPTGALCEDAIKTKKCLKKAAKGKCSKRKFSERKCQLTCGTCTR